MKFLYRYIVIPFLLGIFLFFFKSVYDEVKTETINQFNSEKILIAKSASKGISDFMANLKTSLTFLSLLPEIINFNDKGAEFAKKFYNNHSAQIEAITRKDSNGILIYTFPENKDVIGMDISHQEHFKEVLKEKKPVISDVFMAVQGYLAIAIDVPVFEGNEFKGSLAVLIAIDKIGKRYLENNNKEDLGYAFLLSENNIEIYCPFHDHIGSSVSGNPQNFPSVESFLDSIKKRGSGTVAHFHDTTELAAGTERNINFFRVPLGNTYWTICLSNGVDEAITTIAGFRNRLVILFVILLIILLVYFYFFIKARNVLKEEHKRKLAEEKIKKLNEELEQKVIERTKELEAKNTELDRFNKLFVGRELRMVELKDKIRELENRLNGKAGD